MQLSPCLLGSFPSFAEAVQEQAVPQLLPAEVLVQEQVAELQESEVVIPGSQGSLDLPCSLDLLHSLRSCFVSRSIVLPLAARKDPDKTKFAAVL